MRTHGSSGYRGGCRCGTCRRGHADAMLEVTRLAQARRLAAGLTTAGTPRRTFYDDRALRHMARYGLRPDPRFLQPE